MKRKMIPHIHDVQKEHEQSPSMKCEICQTKSKDSSALTIHVAKTYRLETFNFQDCGSDVHCSTASLQMRHQYLGVLPLSRLLSLVASLATCPSLRLTLSLGSLATWLPCDSLASPCLYLRQSLTLLLPGHGVRPPELEAHNFIQITRQRPTA